MGRQRNRRRRGGWGGGVHGTGEGAVGGGCGGGSGRCERPPLGGAREGEMRAATAGRREGGGDASGGRREHVEIGVQGPSTYGGSPPGLGFYRVGYRVPLQPVSELGPAKFTGPGCFPGCRCGQPQAVRPIAQPTSALVSSKK
jgi:hypothetical protein